jgi:hypothetical protein
MAYDKQFSELGVQDKGFVVEMHDKSRPPELGGNGIQEVEGDAPQRLSPAELRGSIPEYYRLNSNP